MDLKQFVKAVLMDIDGAVTEVNEESARQVWLRHSSEARTVEFDVAVTAESESNQTAGAKLQVAGVALLSGSAGGEKSQGSRESIVSRIRFGVHIEPLTRDEAKKARANKKPGHRMISKGVEV